jgi:prepilin peptidase dependent protein B
MTLSILILGALGLQLTSQLNSSTFNIKQHKVNSNLRSTLDILSHDIMRAGYTNNTTNQSVFIDKTKFNLYTIKKTDGKSFATTSDATCLTFAYDRNDDGSLGNDERFGFAYRDSDKTIVSYRGINPDCSDLSTWIPITNKNAVVVNELTFTLIEPQATAGATELPAGICPLSIKINIIATNAEINNNYIGNQDMNIKIRNDTSLDWNSATNKCDYTRT